MSEHWSSSNGCHPDCPACAEGAVNQPKHIPTPIMLLKRGLESGVFDADPEFKADVLMVIEKSEE